MVTLVNRAKVATATTGTGTITLGAAESGYQSFSDAGLTGSDTVRYTIEDGDAWEIGTGGINAAVTTMSRTLIESSTGSKLILSGDAVVYVTAAGEDIQQPPSEGPFVDGDKTKLDGIEAGATADQTAGEIKTAYESNANTNAYTDAEQTKLAGIEATADVTDAGNVNPLVDAHLNTSSATTGEYLSWTGSDYDWVAVSGYTDADVDTHLNTGTASSGEVLSWNGSDYDWIAVSSGATDINGLSDASTVAGQSLSLLATYNESGSTFIGTNSGGNGQTDSVAIGYLAGALGSGDDNVAIGNNAGRLINSRRNVSIGSSALGFTSLARTGDGNIGVGYRTGLELSTGAYNFLGGYRAGTNLTTGSNNVALGNGANDIGTTNANTIVIGYNADPSSATVSNEITLGNSSITTLRCNTIVITTLSDGRDKTDIEPINAGLSFVEELKPVSFTWDQRDGGRVGVNDAGFIAQDLLEAQETCGVTVPNLVKSDNPDKLEAGYSALIPVMVQAIKELSAEVKDLEAKLEAK